MLLLLFSAPSGPVLKRAPSGSGYSRITQQTTRATAQASTRITQQTRRPAAQTSARPTQQQTKRP